MIVCGYKLRDANEHGLMEMREITFIAEPAELRAMGSFLTQMANEMETGVFRNTHQHIDSVVDDWVKKNPGLTIVVMPPRDG